MVARRARRQGPVCVKIYYLWPRNNYVWARDNISGPQIVSPTQRYYLWPRLSVGFNCFGLFCLFLSFLAPAEYAICSRSARGQDVTY